jgi:hypothetical protein
MLVSMESESKDKGKIIFVNKKEFRVTEDALTGTQILQLAGFDPNQYDLFLIRGQKSDQIAPDQSVKIENGLHFNAIPKNVPYGGRYDP